jgi:hypothetical protein
MQPRGNGVRDAFRLLCQFQKSLLRDLLGHGAIPRHPQRGGMDHRSMGLHQLTKGVGIALGGVALEMLEVGRHGLS